MAGASLRQRFLGRFVGRDTETVIGVQGRHDRIPIVGLYHTSARRRLETIRQDRVGQSSGALFAQASVQWPPWLRTVLGLRGDLYNFDVRSDDPANSGTRTAPSTTGAPSPAVCACATSALGPSPRTTACVASWVIVSRRSRAWRHPANALRDGSALVTLLQYDSHFVL